MIPKPFISSFPRDSSKDIVLADHYAKIGLGFVCNPGIETEVWNGGGGNSFIVTDQTMGMQTIKLPITYSSGAKGLQPHQVRAAVEANVQAVEAGMMLGPMQKFILDVGDGYQYQCVLSGISGTVWNGAGQCSRTYTLHGVKTKTLVTVDLAAWASARLNCISTVPKTDVKITITSPCGGLERIYAQVNSQSFTFIDATKKLAASPVIIDGIDKRILVGGKNLMSLWEWHEFPYLIPGSNRLNISFDGIMSGIAGYAEYYPTFI